MRVSIERSVLTNNFRDETEGLYRQLIAPAGTDKPQHEVIARDPLGGMRKDAAAALVRAFRDGYGRLSKSRVERSYEVRGKKLRNVFDLVVREGTPKKRREHLFHHLLVLPDAEDTFSQAAGLCLRWDDVRAANHADRNLTAVLYHRPGARGTSLPNDAQKILKREEIKVVDMADVPGVAHKYSEQPALPLR